MCLEVQRRKGEGCRSLSNGPDRCSESKLMRYKLTDLLPPLRGLNWVPFMFQEAEEKLRLSCTSVSFERPQVQCPTSCLTLSRFVVYLVVQILKQVRNKWTK